MGASDGAGGVGVVPSAPRPGTGGAIVPGRFMENVVCSDSPLLVIYPVLDSKWIRFLLSDA